MEFEEGLTTNSHRTTFPLQWLQFQFLVVLQHLPMLVGEITAVVALQLLPVWKLQLALTMEEDPCLLYIVTVSKEKTNEIIVGTKGTC